MQEVDELLHENILLCGFNIQIQLKGISFKNEHIKDTFPSDHELLLMQRQKHINDDIHEKFNEKLKPIKSINPIDILYFEENETIISTRNQIYADLLFPNGSL